MKSQILLLALIVAALSSCTTAYKTGQTPDDVYFSPTRPHDEYVQVEKKEAEYRGEDYYEDRYIRMRVQNRYQWSALDDYYFNNPYAYNYYSYYSNWNNPWNSYWTWNNYYNPYCYSGGGIIIKNPAAYKAPPSRPVVFNPSSYLGSTTTTTNTLQSSRVKANSAYYNNSYNSGSTRYNNSNSNRNNYSNSNSNRNSNYTPNNSTPTRSYTPSSSSSSSRSSTSSGSSSSSSGTSRPKR
jgi:hypothetical protein